MPSLWKKPKGNRISRLVSDLQSPPQRGGSLVVETGFPTSLVDLFVKNRDRLKKPTKKKQRSKHKTAIPTTPDHQFPIGPPPTPVSDPVPVSLPELDVPSCLIDEKTEEIVARIENPNLPFEENVDKNGGLDHESCKGEILKGKERVGGDNEGVSSSSNGVWLSILKGALIMFVPLYTKWFVLGILFGALLLLVLEYVGNSIYRLFSSCKKSILLSFAKGAFVVVVAFYTKSFVVGITMGALLLLLLEYVGNLAFRFFKPRDDLERNSQGLNPCRDGSKRKGVLRRAIGIGLNREAQKEGGNGVTSKRAIEQDDGNGVEVGDGVSLGRAIELDVSNKGVAFTNSNKRGSKSEIEQEVGSKGEIELGNASNTIVKGSSCLVEEKLYSEPVCEIETIESKSHPWSRIAGCPGGYYEPWGDQGALEGVEKGGGYSSMVSHNGNKQKGKKFWKRFVPKNMHKKKKHKYLKKHQEKVLADCIVEDITMESDEEEDQDDDEQEMAEGDVSSSSCSLSSSSNEEDRFCGTNHSHAEMSKIDNRTAKCGSMVKEGDGSMKCMTILVISLVGLLRDRTFALILTVICCLIFKMVRG